MLLVYACIQLFNHTVVMMNKSFRIKKINPCGISNETNFSYNTLYELAGNLKLRVHGMLAHDFYFNNI